MEKISVAVRFRPPHPAAADPSPAGAGGGGDREGRIDDTRVSLLHRAAGPVPGASFAFGMDPPPLTTSLSFTLALDP
jgi:centromeric protein E